MRFATACFANSSGFTVLSRKMGGWRIEIRNGIVKDLLEESSLSFPGPQAAPFILVRSGLMVLQRPTTPYLYQHSQNLNCTYRTPLKRRMYMGYSHLASGR